MFCADYISTDQASIGIDALEDNYIRASAELKRSLRDVLEILVVSIMKERPCALVQFITQQLEKELDKRVVFEINYRQKMEKEAASETAKQQLLKIDKDYDDSSRTNKLHNFILNSDLTNCSCREYRAVQQKFNKADKPRSQLGPDAGPPTATDLNGDFADLTDLKRSLESADNLSQKVSQKCVASFIGDVMKQLNEISDRIADMDKRLKSVQAGAGQTALQDQQLFVNKNLPSTNSEPKAQVEGSKRSSINRSNDPPIEGSKRSSFNRSKEPPVEGSKRSSINRSNEAPGEEKWLSSRSTVEENKRSSKTLNSSFDRWNQHLQDENKRNSKSIAFSDNQLEDENKRNSKSIAFSNNQLESNETSKLEANEFLISKETFASDKSANIESMTPCQYPASRQPSDKKDDKMRTPSACSTNFNMVNQIAKESPRSQKVVTKDKVEDSAKKSFYGKNTEDGTIWKIEIEECASCTTSLDAPSVDINQTLQF